MEAKLFHRLALIVFMVFVLSVGDACLSTLDPSNLYRIAPGQTVPVSGDLIEPPLLGARMDNPDPTPEEITGLISYETDSPDLSMTLLELKGRVWRGTLTARPTAKSGQYGFKVYNLSDTSQEQPIYVVRLFPDAAALQADLPSFAARYLGIRPIWITFGTLPVGILMFLLSFLRSGREEEALQARGVGSIYKLAKRKTEWEIIFGLGSEHGVHPGDRLLVLDRKQQVVGELTASRVGIEGSHATLPLDADIRPGYFVALADREPPGITQP